MLKSRVVARYWIAWTLALVAASTTAAQPERVVLVSIDGLAAYHLTFLRIENGKVTNHIDFTDFAEGLRQIEAQR